MRNDPDSLRELVGETHGRFFSVLFVTKKLVAREMRCRLKVLEGETFEVDRRTHNVTVWDLDAGGWRRIPLDRLVHLKCGALQWTTSVSAEDLQAMGGAA